MSIPLIHSQFVGRGQPVVLLHAFPLSHQIWKGIQPPQGFRFILPDFPGFGSTPIAQEGLSLEDISWGLQKHLEESGINEPFIMAGISMGGYWAFEYVRLYPEKIRKLVLISTRPGVDSPENRLKRLEIANKVEKDGTAFLAEAMLPGLLGKTTRENNSAVVLTVNQWIRDANPRAVAQAQRAMANRRDQTQLMSQIPVPTLVLAGKEDTLIPATEAENMAKRLPHAELKIFENTGHLIPLEKPRVFEKTLSEFFQS